MYVCVYVCMYVCMVNVGFIPCLDRYDELDEEITTMKTEVQNFKASSVKLDIFPVANAESSFL